MKKLDNGFVVKNPKKLPNLQENPLFLHDVFQSMLTSKLDKPFINLLNK